MHIKNETTGKILSDSAVKAQTLFQKTFGLIFLQKPTAMIFQTRFGIHTFFMKYPIDVLVLDKEQKVVATKHGLKPNRIFLWNPKFTTIIELPENAIKKTETKLGNKITF